MQRAWLVEVAFLAVGGVVCVYLFGLLFLLVPYVISSVVMEVAVRVLCLLKQAGNFYVSFRPYQVSPLF